MSLTFWNPSIFGGGFDDDFFTDPTFFRGPPTLTNFKADTMLHSSPKYEVTQNDKQFRLAVDVPGVKPDQMKIELENDGRVLHMSGGGKAKTDTSYEEYKYGVFDGNSPAQVSTILYEGRTFSAQRCSRTCFSVSLRSAAN